MSGAPEKPLHVLVAEALGWRSIREFPLGSEAGSFVYNGVPPEWQESDLPIPHYDTDWSATGPLIERYGLAVTPPLIMPSGEWAASSPEDQHLHIGLGETALLAVCNLLLALSEAGKLTVGQVRRDMGSHTPGPWQYIEVEPGHVVDAEGSLIAEVWGVLPSRDATEVQANGRLIAAAPYLLRCARDARSCSHTSGVKRCADRLCRAIAKAEGRP